MQNLVLILLLSCFSSVNIFAQAAELPEDVCPLLIGETLPNAALKDEKGKLVSLNSVLSEKPTVLIIYRGGWCPYCNKQLSAFAIIENAIFEMGYQIVAVSPDDYKNIRPTVETDALKYQVYSDPDSKFIQQLGLAFKSDKKIKEYMSKKNQGLVTEIIPVPAVFVANTKGEILFEYINPDYSKRISSGLLLAVLKNLDAK